MNILKSVLVMEQIFRYADSYSIIDCTFHAINVNKVDHGVIQIQSTNTSGLFSISSTAILNCRTYIGGFNNNAVVMSYIPTDMKFCLMSGCESRYSTVTSYEACSLNYSVFTQCFGLDYMFIYEILKSINCNHTAIKQYHFDFYTFTLTEDYHLAFCSFHQIESQNAFLQKSYDAYGLTVRNSLFMSCSIENFHVPYLIDCYFYDCSMRKDSLIQCTLQNCLFDESCRLHDINISKTSIPEIIKIDIPAIDSFNFRQKDQSESWKEYSSPLAVSDIVNQLALKGCVFKDIYISNSSDSVIIIASSFFKNLEIKNSYFSNCSSIGNTGMLYIPTSPNTTITNSLVKNIVSNDVAFLQSKDGNPITAFQFNQTSYTVDSPPKDFKRTTEHIFFNNPIISSNINFSSTNLQLNNGFHAKNLDLHHSNFIDITNISCLYHTPFYLNVSYTNFINAKPDNLALFSENVISHCSFINSTEPEKFEGNLNCFESSESKCDIYSIDFQFNWATPKIKKNHWLSNTEIAFIAIGTVILVVSSAFLFYGLYHCKMIKVYKERRVLEKNVMDDFG